MVKYKSRIADRILERKVLGKGAVDYQIGSLSELLRIL